MLTSVLVIAARCSARVLRMRTHSKCLAIVYLWSISADDEGETVPRVQIEKSATLQILPRWLLHRT